MLLKWAVVFVFFALPLLEAPAAAATIDFETLSDRELLTTQFPGVLFSNAMALTSGFLGGSLNELENPPHSGVTVITDNLGLMTLEFLSPITSFSGFFTYRVPLIVSAFDQFGNLLGSRNSSFTNNQGLSGVQGSSPNELIAFNSGPGISRIVISGSSQGNSFTIDDVNTIGASPVPEPETLSLLFAGGLTVFALHRRSKLKIQR